jgi:hypothetical protein
MPLMLVGLLAMPAAILVGGACEACGSLRPAK